MNETTAGQVATNTVLTVISNALPLFRSSRLSHSTDNCSGVSDEDVDLLDSGSQIRTSVRYTQNFINACNELNHSRAKSRKARYFPNSVISNGSRQLLSLTGSQ